MFGRATIRLGIGPHSSFVITQSKVNRISKFFHCQTSKVILYVPSQKFMSHLKQLLAHLLVTTAVKLKINFTHSLYQPLQLTFD